MGVSEEENTAIASESRAPEGRSCFPYEKIFAVFFSAALAAILSKSDRTMQTGL